MRSPARRQGRPAGRPRGRPPAARGRPARRRGPRAGRRAPGARPPPRAPPPAPAAYSRAAVSASPRSTRRLGQPHPPLGDLQLERREALAHEGVVRRDRLGATVEAQGRVHVAPADGRGARADEGREVVRPIRQHRGEAPRPPLRAAPRAAARSARPVSRRPPGPAGASAASRSGARPTPCPRRARRSTPRAAPPPRRPTPRRARRRRTRSPPPRGPGAATRFAHPGEPEGGRQHAGGEQRRRRGPAARLTEGAPGSARAPGRTSRRRGRPARPATSCPSTRPAPYTPATPRRSACREAQPDAARLEVEPGGHRREQPVEARRGERGDDGAARRAPPRAPPAAPRGVRSALLRTRRRGRSAAPISRSTDSTEASRSSTPGGGRVHHVQQQVRLLHLLERRPERRHQRVGQLLDEAHRVHEEDLPPRPQPDLPHERVEGHEELVRDRRRRRWVRALKRVDLPAFV